MNRKLNEGGLALLSVLMLTALMMSLLTGYFLVTHIDLSTTRSSAEGTRGFYAAEAGVNLRSASIRSTFEGFNVPAGTAPDEANGPVCQGSNSGSGDFACAGFTIDGQPVTTYMQEQAGNPTTLVVPRGEPFQNLNANEYRYVVHSQASSNEARTEAALEMSFKARLIPMFQFAAFYNKDLEILPGPAMTLAGPVHSNGDLYLGAGASLAIQGQVTTGGDMYRGRKNSNTCSTGPVTVPDPAVAMNLPTCSGTRELLNQTDLDAWNGMVRTHIDTLEVPAPDALDPVQGNDFWDLADLRIALDLGGGLPGTIEVRKADGTADALKTTLLNSCGTVTSSSGSFYNNREGTAIEMMEVDMQGLLDCLQSNPLMGVSMNDTSQGGLVFHLTVDGPDSSGINNYGVRLKNGQTLASTVPGAPAVNGVTVVTDQAIYIQGNYNSTAKKPAAVLADSLNVLSTSWDDANSTEVLDNRVAGNTVINAAFLNGTDLTGGAEGTAGQDSGSYNGGLENYPRFHEKWTGRTLTYRGSFVSLYEPRHVNGAWVYGGMQYKAPNRDWSYDTDFNNMANLPPLSPRFVYLKQELFIRQFEL